MVVLGSYEQDGVTFDLDDQAIANAFKKFKAIENDAGRLVHDRQQRPDRAGP